MAGRDPQLERAVAEILAAIESAGAASMDSSTSGLRRPITVRPAGRPARARSDRSRLGRRTAPARCAGRAPARSARRARRAPSEIQRCQNASGIAAAYSDRRQLALPVAADRLPQQRVLRPASAMIGCCRMTVGDRRHQQHDAVERRRQRTRSGSRPSSRWRTGSATARTAGAGWPTGCAPGHPRRRRAACGGGCSSRCRRRRSSARSSGTPGSSGTQRREVVAVRHLQLEHHDRDDDGEHAVAEALEAALASSLTAAYSRQPAAPAGAFRGRARVDVPRRCQTAISQNTLELAQRRSEDCLGCAASAHERDCREWRRPFVH